VTYGRKINGTQSTHDIRYAIGITHSGIYNTHGITHSGTHSYTTSTHSYFDHHVTQTNKNLKITDANFSSGWSHSKGSTFSSFGRTHSYFSQHMAQVKNGISPASIAFAAHKGITQSSRKIGGATFSNSILTNVKTKYFTQTNSTTPKIKAGILVNIVSTMKSISVLNATDMIQKSHVTVNNNVINDINHVLVVGDVVRIGTMGHFLNNGKNIVVID
jgi:hypothetical protein